MNSLNIIDIAFLMINGFGVLQALLIGIVLFTIRSKNRLPNIFLGSFICCLAIFISILVFEELGFYIYFPHTLGVTYLFDFSIPVLFYFYIKFFSDPKFLVKKIHLLHIIPFIITFILVLPLLLMSPDQKIAYYNNNNMSESTFYVITFFNTVYLVYYLWISFTQILKASKTPSLSQKSKDILKWLKTLTTVLTVIIIISTTLDSIPTLRYIDEFVTSFMLTILIYGIAIIGFRQSEVFSVGFEQIEKYQKSNLTDVVVDEIQSKLQNLMIKDEIFTDPLINLSKVAKMVGVSKHNLSQVINQKMEMTFPQYLNYLRIEKAQEILADKDSLNRSISDIGYSVGYNSLTSFNNYFKKQTDQSPSGFRKQSNS